MRKKAVYVFCYRCGNEFAFKEMEQLNADADLAFQWRLNEEDNRLANLHTEFSVSQIKKNRSRFSYSSFLQR